MDGLMSSENQEGTVQPSRFKKQGQKLSLAKKGVITAGAVAVGVGSLMVGPEKKAFAGGPDLDPSTPITTTVKPEGLKPTPTPDAVAERIRADLANANKREAEENQRQEGRPIPTGITPVPVATAVIEQPRSPQSVGRASLEDENTALKKNNDFIALIGGLLAVGGVALGFLGLLMQRLRGRRTHQSNTNFPDINIMPRKKKFGFF